MTYVYYMFRSIALSLISVLEILMLARAVMSWFPQVQGNRFHQAVIMPFRSLVNQIPALRGFPLDISFMLAYLALIVIETVI